MGVGCPTSPLDGGERDRHGALVCVRGDAPRREVVMHVGRLTSWSIGMGWTLGILSGCATMFPPAADMVSIQSHPAGAQVFIDGESRGTTPLVLPLTCTPREPTVRVEMPGYVPFAQVLPTVSGFDGRGTVSWPVERCASTFHVTMGRLDHQ